MDIKKIGIAVVALVAGAALVIFFLFRKKKPASTGWKQAPPAAYKTSNLLANAASVTDQGKRQMITLNTGVGKELFGTSSDKVFVPTPSTGVSFTPSEALINKLRAKFGEGQLTQTGANLLQGFDYKTNNGDIKHLTLVELMALSR